MADDSSRARINSRKITTKENYRSLDGKSTTHNDGEGLINYIFKNFQTKEQTESIQQAIEEARRLGAERRDYQETKIDRKTGLPNNLRAPSCRNNKLKK